MMKTVKHTFTSIGDRSGEIARTFGSGTAGLVRQFGSGTTGLARRIGPKRALIGLAVAAVAVGGSIVLIRYLRGRNRADGLATDQAGENGQPISTRRSRTARNADAQVSHQG